MLNGGSVPDSVKKQMLKFTGKLPEKFRDRTLRQDLLFFLNAFFDLETERPISFSVGYIPWSKIIEYSIFYKLDSRQRDRFIFLIREMDNEYVKYQREKEKKDAKKSS
jgi:hypothetical protein